MNFDKLTTPFVLPNGQVLKNRLLSPNVLHSYWSNGETWPNDGYTNQATEFCSAGAALYSWRHHGLPFGGGSTGASDPHAGGRRSIACFDYEDQAVWHSLAQLAEQTHMFGSKALVRLWFVFPKGYSYGGGFSFGRQTEPYPKEKFPELIQQYIDLLKLYKMWGYDGVNLRPTQQLCASDNHRTDEYGGEIENRGRFFYEMFDAIKRELGEDFITEIVLQGEVPHGYNGGLEKGYSLDEAIRFAKLIEDRIDILQLRDPGMAEAHPIGYNHGRGEHLTVEYCRAFKEAGVKVPIAPNGGYGDPEEMERLLEDGTCDLISAGRALIAEPDYMRKLFFYPKEKPTPCIQCNKCHGTSKSDDMNVPPFINFCSVNPKSGMQQKLPAIIKPTWTSKKVAVIGGGPIGMRAACFAAERGHKVTLFEKTGYLGGKLSHAEIYPFKWPIKDYRDWLVEELDRRGVVVHLNHEPTPEEIKAEGFDSVIAATGSNTKLPNIPGITREDGTKNENVWTIQDVYEQKAELGKRVVIVGGSESNMETAMYLCRTGHDVTVLTRHERLMHDNHSIHYVTMSHTYIPEGQTTGYMAPDWHRDENLTHAVFATTTKVTPNSVTFTVDLPEGWKPHRIGQVPPERFPSPYNENREYTIECDSIVVNGGQFKEVPNAMRYAGCAPEFFMAGDVEDHCSDLQTGNRSAYGKACLL
ncbi:MAG: FAD-dependent oxidoreductase [Oscillospiraceae bacterium]|nr:FAD-dependent oxidoreductase [Oscillospiraceae bacterium]